MARKADDVKKKDAGKLRQDTLKAARATLLSMQGKSLADLSVSQRNELLVIVLQTLGLVDATGKIL